MATRFQPDRDLIVLSGMRTLPLDPSLISGRVGAEGRLRPPTWPFGSGNAGWRRGCRSRLRFAGRRFASIEAALADGPKYFEELMTAVGSRDGREIVRALEALRGRRPSTATARGAIVIGGEYGRQGSRRAIADRRSQSRRRHHREVP